MSKKERLARENISAPIEREQCFSAVLFLCDVVFEAPEKAMGGGLRGIFLFSLEEGCISRMNTV